MDKISTTRVCAADIAHQSCKRHHNLQEWSTSGFLSLKHSTQDPKSRESSFSPAWVTCPLLQLQEGRSDRPKAGSGEIADRRMPGDNQILSK